MAVLIPIPATTAQAPAAEASGPVCSLQRSGSLWQLGIEAQELTTAIGQLADQLDTDHPEQHASALAELEAALLAEEGNKGGPGRQGRCHLLGDRSPAWPGGLPPAAGQTPQ